MYIAKRLLKIVAFMCVIAVIYLTGAYGVPDFDSMAPTPTMPPPYMPPEEHDPIYTELGAPAVIEYGTPVVLIHNNDPLHAYISYPQAGNDADEAIQKWANDLYSSIAVQYTTGAQLSYAEFGEINVHFDSYLIDNRYAGIHQHGQYSLGASEQPVEVFKTFNLELTQFRTLEPDEILDFENIDAVLQLLRLRMLVEHPKTDGYLDFMDENWLKSILITHNGIKVFLPDGEFLPDSFKSLTVTLPFEDLGASLLIRNAAPLPSMPTPTIEPTMTPTPTPTPTPIPDDAEDADADRDEGADGSEGADNAADNTADNAGDENAGGAENDADSGDSDGNGSGEPDDMDEPVETPRQSDTIDRTMPLIAITFDDGPGAFTGQLLELLEKHNARATFFTIGKMAHLGKDELQRAVDIGCEVAGHSWNHKNLAKMSADDVKMQLETTRDAIEEITGKRPAIFRPPYGAVSDSMRAVAQEMEMSIIRWNVDPEDWREQDSDAIYEQIMAQVENRAIILSHELYAPTIEAYRRLIPDLIRQGYQLVTVSELIEITQGKLTPGEVYTSAQRVEPIS